MFEEIARTPFADRVEAGRQLGARLVALNLAHPVVLALPRGGVPIGLEVARALDAPLDLLLVRKIGVPWQPELAVAAVMDGAEPVVVIERHVQAEAGVKQEYINERARQSSRRSNVGAAAISRTGRPWRLQGARLSSLTTALPPARRCARR